MWGTEEGWRCGAEDAQGDAGLPLSLPKPPSLAEMIVTKALSGPQCPISKWGVPSFLGCHLFSELLKPLLPGNTKQSPK